MADSLIGETFDGPLVGTLRTVPGAVSDTLHHTDDALFGSASSSGSQLMAAPQDEHVPERRRHS